VIVQGITLNGFKSFYRKADIDLNFGITAFVGPNGSGKSNVADAIRWVLGEQSVKHIRASKQEDVIFAGSTTKAPKGVADVTLQFDNNTNFFDVPFKEVAITRRFFRDGQGEYALNTRPLLLRELRELLAKSALGSFDLTVIGQGEIDQILIMGSAQIKSLLEDASGVKPFYIKKQRIIRNLSRNTENVVRLHDILQELEPRLKQLQRESKQAEAYIKFKQELKDLQDRWYAGQLARIEQDLASVRTTRTGIQDSKNSLYAVISAKEKQVESITQELSKRQESVSKKQSEIDGVQKELNAFWQEQAGITAKLELNQSQLANLQREKKTDTSGLEQEQKDLTTRLHATQEAIQKAVQTEKAKREEIDALMQSYQALLGEIDALRQEIARRSDITVVRGKFGELKKLYARLTDKLFGKKIALEELQRAYREAEHIHERIAPLLAEIDNSLSSEETEDMRVIKEKQAQSTELFAKTGILQKELRNLTGERDRLEREKYSIQGRLQQVNQQVVQAHAASAQTDQKGLIEALHKEQEYLLEQQRHLASQIEGKQQEVETMKKNLQELFSQQEENNRLHALRSQIGDTQRELGKLKNQDQELLLQQTRLETRREDVLERARVEMGLTMDEHPEAPSSVKPSAPQKVLAPEDLSRMEDEIIRLRGQIERIGEVNQKAPAEYEEVKNRYQWLYERLEDLDLTARFIEKELKNLDEYVAQLFEKVFTDTQIRFSEYFELLFGGGEGQLVRAEDTIFEEGEILIRARPPGKRMHDLNLLSGGERSLGAVALLFAILESCGTPFCVLDEVDAALDEANVGRFCDALRRLNSRTQVIMITHNRRTMEAADCLYGTTMQDDGTSQIVSLKLQDYQAGKKAV